MPLEQNSTVLYDNTDTETGIASNPLRVDPTGSTPQPIVEDRPANAAVTSVAASVITVTFLIANTSRRMASIANDSKQSLYIKLGTGASLISYTVKLGEDDYYELPFPAYTGIITGVWEAGAVGSALVTEIT